MKTYEYADCAVEEQKDQIVIALRKSGFSAYRQDEQLMTDASVAQIAWCSPTGNALHIIDIR